MKGANKAAYLSGSSFDLAVVLPSGPASADGHHVITAADALIALRSIGSTRPDGTHLTITDVAMGTGMFSTDRGPRPLPAWIFTFNGVAQPARVLAIPAADRWPHRGMPTASGVQIGVATSADGHHVTISFVGAHPGSGPCDAEYAGAVAQSTTAVSVSVRKLPNPNSSPTTMCDAIGYTRTVTLTLTPALGNRVLVDSKGAAIPAT